jgi:hypothetical protein
MKSRKFSVPADSIVEFAEIVENNELETKIVGTDEDNDENIIVEIRYEQEERSAVFELMELLDPDDEG